MKKVLGSFLTVLFVIGFMYGNITISNTETTDDNITSTKVLPVENHCWEIADAIEEAHCGYVGCDGEWWVYAYETCLEYTK